MARDDEAEEENTVVLSQIKSNLGPLDVPSLKFTFQPVTVETEDGRAAHVGRLVELGETERSVADILSGRGDEADQDTWNAACWWLYDYLRKLGGEATARDVWTHGKAAGHSRDSLKRASRTLALVKRKSGFQGQSLWVFDSTESRAPQGERPGNAAAASGGKESQPQKRSRRVTGDGGTVVPLRPGTDGGNKA
jgi:hypothetical protein